MREKAYIGPLRVGRNWVNKEGMQGIPGRVKDLREDIIVQGVVDQ